MIWLSDSALKYAASVCQEISEYKAIIFVKKAQDVFDASLKMRTYIKNKHATARMSGNAWIASYENGSLIKIIVANDNARGNRCHLAVVSQAINRDIINEVIRTMEYVDPPLNPQRVDDNTNTDNVVTVAGTTVGYDGQDWIADHMATTVQTGGFVGNDTTTPNDIVAAIEGITMAPLTATMTATDVNVTNTITTTAIDYGAIQENVGRGVLTYTHNW